jgi:hypothetical protein
MYVSEDTLGGLRSPYREGARSSSGEHLHQGTVPAGHRGAGKKFEVHLVETGKDRALASELLNRMYDWRGYGANHALAAAEGSNTFAVSVDGQIICTLTLTVDSGAGLAADKTFRNVLAGAREVSGASLCELTKFACSPSEDSRFLLAALFHTIFIFGTEQYNCTDLFIEVNPRHIRFYEAMLGFEKVGELRTNEGVDAPSQLMRLKVANIASNIKRHVGRDDRAALRSLYPCFLSQDEEQVLRARVRNRFKTVAALDLLAA